MPVIPLRSPAFTGICKVHNSVTRIVGKALLSPCFCRNKRKLLPSVDNFIMEKNLNASREAYESQFIRVSPRYTLDEIKTLDKQWQKLGILKPDGSPNRVSYSKIKTLEDNNRLLNILKIHHNMLYQLNKIGNNLNQIAKGMHVQKGTIHWDIFESVNKDLRKTLIEFL